MHGTRMADKPRTEPPPKESSELRRQEQSEERRKLVDEAKKRAVAQGVDYEQFKEIASAAHLKPIQSQAEGKSTNAQSLPHLVTPEGTVAPPPQQQSEGPAPINPPVTKHHSSGHEGFAPTTPEAFNRAWELASGDVGARARLLSSVEEEVGLASVFRVEAPAWLVKGAAQALEASLGEAIGNDQAIRALKGLARVPRSTLSGKLIGREGKESIKSLVNALREHDESVHEVLTSLGVD